MAVGNTTHLSFDLYFSGRTPQERGVRMAEISKEAKCEDTKLKKLAPCIRPIKGLNEKVDRLARTQIQSLQGLLNYALKRNKGLTHLERLSIFRGTGPDSDYATVKDLFSFIDAVEKFRPDLEGRAAFEAKYSISDSGETLESKYDEILVNDFKELSQIGSSQEIVTFLKNYKQNHPEKKDFVDQLLRKHKDIKEMTRESYPPSYRPGCRFAIDYFTNIQDLFDGLMPLIKEEGLNIERFTNLRDDLEILSHIIPFENKVDLKSLHTFVSFFKNHDPKGFAEILNKIFELDNLHPNLFQQGLGVLNPHGKDQIKRRLDLLSSYYDDSGMILEYFIVHFEDLLGLVGSEDLQIFFVKMVKQLIEGLPQAQVSKEEYQTYLEQSKLIDISDRVESIFKKMSHSIRSNEKGSNFLLVTIQQLAADPKYNGRIVADKLAQKLDTLLLNPPPYAPLQPSAPPYAPSQASAPPLEQLNLRVQAS